MAVVDTGVRPHADLAANLLPGYDFISMTTVSNDGDGPRTPMPPTPATARSPVTAAVPRRSARRAGTARTWPVRWRRCRTTAWVWAGVAFNAKIVPVRVLGKCGGYTSDIADGVIWAAGGSVAGVPNNANPARVINMSLGGSGVCGPTMQGAINAARSRGTVVVVAAGNSNAPTGQFQPRAAPVW